MTLTSGDLHGVHSDSPVNLSVRHIGDLLEEAGKTWKVYAENYPGHCFTGAFSADYARKHNPFISYQNIQNDPKRCAEHILDSAAFTHDVQAGTLPDYSLYVPDMKNDGHDTGAAFADQWLAKTFLPLLKDPHFTQDLLLILTFDEGSISGANLVYTVFLGDGVIPGSTSPVPLTHPSLLSLIEAQFSLGNLGLGDTGINPISGVWK